MVSRLNNSENYALVYKFFSSIEKKSDANQRKLAAELGISLGKLNYLLNDFIEKGFVEVLKTTSNKYGACLYKLTPSGMVERVAVTSRYLQSLINQQQSITNEIALLKERQQTIKEEIENLKCETNQIGNAIQAGISKLRGKGSKGRNIAYNNAENRSGAYCG